MVRERSNGLNKSCLFLLGSSGLGKPEHRRSFYVLTCYTLQGRRHTGHLTVSPRKERPGHYSRTGLLKWSSEPDSHRSYEYDIVEILSDDTTDGAAGVSVAFLHKAKGFASVFFRMGTGDADTTQILPQNTYQFSHMIPSFKLTGFESKGLPKDAYELDQAALPATVQEKAVPSHLIQVPKPEALCFPSKHTGKVFQMVSSGHLVEVTMTRRRGTTVGFRRSPIWAPHFDVGALDEHCLDFDMVQVLDDALDYKVLALKQVVVASEEKNKFFRAAKSRPSYCYDEDGPGVIFTIPQSKMLRFSHPIPASRVTKEVDGEMIVLFEVDKKRYLMGGDR
ncbi:hypothetical protein Rs2_44934 [Raphanus sativus]|nr:hypothetical protein Rs2_44934 [Raphanus sativus]